MRVNELVAWRPNGPRTAAQQRRQTSRGHFRKLAAVTATVQYETGDRLLVTSREVFAPPANRVVRSRQAAAQTNLLHSNHLRRLAMAPWYIAFAVLSHRRDRELVPSFLRRCESDDRRIALSVVPRIERGSDAVDAAFETLGESLSGGRMTSRPSAASSPASNGVAGICVNTVQFVTFTLIA